VSVCSCRRATRASASAGKASASASRFAAASSQVLPKRLGPKRATKIRRFFNLSKEDDVRKFVIRREVVPKKEGAKPYTKACVSLVATSAD
jgi:hypothetical protein